ncbi:MAG: NADPH-dependent glutamate synthase [Ruminococcaceae bacterium]|nr:NADPH-dependent glutamate synthase [Oscillospiraceae bacterium]
MPNMQKEKTKIAEQAPDIRNKNFNEVSLGYTASEAKNEAERCLNCKAKPCVKGCPVNVCIPEFIEQIKSGNFEKAYELLSATNALPAICGRVCPQENQCEKYCVRAIKGEAVAIGRLERFVADYAMENLKASKPVTAKINKKVAVIGSGPAGLTCANELAKKGYEVTIFEAMHEAGGVLTYGIPEFRLPKAIVKNEIEKLKQNGVNIVLNMVIGKILSVDELFEEGYEAVFIGSGAGLPMFMGIEGECLNGVYSANEYLTRINLMKAYEQNSDTPVLPSKTTVVVGGGNVAMDAARCAKRMGAQNVYIVYRRSEKELPARKEEVEHALEEGIILKLLASPIKLEGDSDGRVKKVICTEMELLKAEKEGERASVIPKPDSQFEIEADTVIMAIGTSPNPLIRTTTPGLETNKKGCIVIDEKAMTSREGVFAGGDIATGAATVILAMGAGKKAAACIDEYLKNKR